MDIKLQLIIGFSYLYGFVELVMGFVQKRRGTVTTSSDKGSIWFLLSCIALGYVSTFVIGASTLGRIYHWDLFFAIGALMVVTGSFIRVNAIMTLKHHFTYTVTNVENHELIETGLYKYLRHPGYLGQVLIFTGIATGLSNWLSISVMFILVMIGFSYRIKVEEKFLVAEMGEKYMNYQKRTKRLFLGIY